MSSFSSSDSDTSTLNHEILETIQVRKGTISGVDAAEHKVCSTFALTVRSIGFARGLFTFKEEL